jgi:hypothetical protein
MRHSAKLLFVLFALMGLNCAPADPTPRVANNGENRVDDKPSAVSTSLKDRIEAAIDHVRSRPLRSDLGFWTIFHGILGLGPETTMLVNPDTKEQFNAVDYICKGNPVRGLRFFVTAHGLDVETAKLPDVPDRDVPIFVGQGHQDQFVCEMVQWGLPADRKFVVEGKNFTFQDFINHTKARASVTQKQELSWAIVIIGQYFGTDITWTNLYGETVRFEDLIRYELNEPMDIAACGGTHRLFGLTWCLYLHRHSGGKLDGVWKDVAAKLEDHKFNAKKNRHGDGSFSTEYFKSPAGNDPTLQIRIGTTGHILEWLSLYLPDDELKAAWLQEAASTLSKMILDTHLDPIEGGALYHAAHGLHLYHDRVFGDPKAKRPYPLPVE